MSYVSGIRLSKNGKLVSTETISPITQAREEEAEAGLLLKQSEMQTPDSHGNHMHSEARRKSLLCKMMIRRVKKYIFKN